MARGAAERRTYSVGGHCASEPEQQVTMGGKGKIERLRYLESDVVEERRRGIFGVVDEAGVASRGTGSKW